MLVVLLILFIVALQFLARVYVYSVAYTVATVASTLSENQGEKPQRMRISIRFREDNPNGKCTKCKSWIAPLGCGCIVIDF